MPVFSLFLRIEIGGRLDLKEIDPLSEMMPTTKQENIVEYLEAKSSEILNMIDRKAFIMKTRLLAVKENCFEFLSMQIGPTLSRVASSSGSSSSLSLLIRQSEGYMKGQLHHCNSQETSIYDEIFDLLDAANLFIQPFYDSAGIQVLCKTFINNVAFRESALEQTFYLEKIYRKNMEMARKIIDSAQQDVEDRIQALIYSLRMKVRMYRSSLQQGDRNGQKFRYTMIFEGSLVSAGSGFTPQLRGKLLNNVQLLVNKCDETSLQLKHCLQEEIKKRDIGINSRIMELQSLKIGNFLGTFYHFFPFL